MDLDKLLDQRAKTAPPLDARDYWVWMFERNAVAHMHEQRGYRLSNRATRFLDSEVREDVAVFGVIGRERIDAVETFLRETFGNEA